MPDATEVRVGNCILIDGKICKVLSQEIRGTGKFGKMVHFKVRGLEDGNVQEKSFRAEDRIDSADVEHHTLQFMYRDGDSFAFMDMGTYEQYSLSQKTVGKQEVFLKEGLEIDVLFVDNRPLSIDFPKMVELKVTGSTPPTKGGGDSNYKEIELENGLKLLAPQFIKEGDMIRVNAEDFTYSERVTLKSMGSGAPVSHPTKAPESKK